MLWPLWFRRVYCWCWNKFHGYPCGSREDLSGGGAIITIQTGKIADGWCFREHLRRKHRDLHLTGTDDPC